MKGLDSKVADTLRVISAKTNLDAIDRGAIAFAAEQYADAGALLLGAESRLEGMETALAAKDRQIEALNSQIARQAPVVLAAVKLVNLTGDSIMALDSQAWHDLQRAVNGDGPDRSGEQK